MNGTGPCVGSLISADNYNTCYFSLRQFLFLTDIKGRVTGIKRAEAEREKLQAQLNQAQKMESVCRLAGGVVHDLLGYTVVVTTTPGEAIHRPPRRT